MSLKTAKLRSSIPYDYNILVKFTYHSNRFVHTSCLLIFTFYNKSQYPLFKHYSEKLQISLDCLKETATI